MDTSFTSQDMHTGLLGPGGGLPGLGAAASTGIAGSSGIYVGDIISRLYPNVNQTETPLPRQWSAKDKCQTLSLSMNNSRVTYKGPGKTHKDAASVRTDFPIPAACGIYYFEVKVLSKGRDGYMGIGLSKSDVMLSRLPGWDKNSYGYHGDDGHSFCCSGTGQNYGPTFSTDDVIGCCLNLIENTCFYTKNGYNLGIAFRDLPVSLKFYRFKQSKVLFCADFRVIYTQRLVCRHRASRSRRILGSIRSSLTFIITLRNGI